MDGALGGCSIFPGFAESIAFLVYCKLLPQCRSLHLLLSGGPRDMVSVTGEEVCAICLKRMEKEKAAHSSRPYSLCFSFS